MNLSQASKGFAFSLALINWDVFSTLTFKGVVPSERHAWRLAWRHLHQVSEILDVPYSSLLIALRSEHGEMGDRLHFHYLLGRTGVGSNPHTLAFRIAYDWKCLSSGGHGEVRPYDRKLAGSDYIEKCLSGANSYELGKFNRSDRLELSRLVYVFVRKHMRSTQRDKASQDGAKNTGAAEAPALAERPGVEPLLSPA